MTTHTIRARVDWVVQKEIFLIVWLQQRLYHLVFPNYIALFLHYIIKDEALILLTPIVIWVWDYRLAANFIIITSIVELVNGILKWIIRIARPVWVSNRIINIKGAWEEDYSTPSSHAMLSTSMLVLFLWYHPYTWGIPIGCVLLVLVGTARVYLGVHYPHDVVLGWILAGAISWAYVALAPVVLPAPLVPGSKGLWRGWQSFLWLFGWICVIFSVLLIIRKVLKPETKEQRMAWQENGRRSVIKHKTEKLQKSVRLENLPENPVLDVHAGEGPSSVDVVVLSEKELAKFQLHPRRIGRYLLPLAGCLAVTFSFVLLYETKIADPPGAVCGPGWMIFLRLLIGLTVVVIMEIPVKSLLKRCTSKYGKFTQQATVLLVNFLAWLWVTTFSVWFYSKIGWAAQCA